MAEVQDQDDATPTRKVTAATAASAASALIVFGLDKAGVELGPLEAGAIATVLVFVAGWMKREKK